MALAFNFSPNLAVRPLPPHERCDRKREVIRGWRCGRGWRYVPYLFRYVGRHRANQGGSDPPQHLQSAAYNKNKKKGKIRLKYTCLLSQFARSNQCHVAPPHTTTTTQTTHGYPRYILPKVDSFFFCVMLLLFISLGAGIILVTSTSTYRILSQSFALVAKILWNEHLRNNT